MPKLLFSLLILTAILLQSCQHNDFKEEEVSNPKTNLSKAATYNVQLGLGYLKQGDRPRAKRKLLTAIKQAPNSPDVNSAMAYYFEQSNEMEKAKKYYLKAIDLSSSSGAQLNNYGTFLCRIGDYTHAEPYFLKAVKDEQYIHTSGAYENAGLCALEVPDVAKAKQYFTLALNHDPSRRESLLELVKLAQKKGNAAEALLLFKEHPDLVLNDKMLLAMAKEMASKEGKMDLALAYENKLKEMEPGIVNSGVKNEYNNHIG